MRSFSQLSESECLDGNLMPRQARFIGARHEEDLETLMPSTVSYYRHGCMPLLDCWRLVV